MANYKTVFEANVFSIVCKAKRKHGLQLYCWPTNDSIDGTLFEKLSSDGILTEIKKAAPYLNQNEITSLFFGGRLILLFDSAKERDTTYWNTVGDDGPTKTNKYNGEIRIHAQTCSPTGQLLNENT